MAKYRLWTSTLFWSFVILFLAMVPIIVQMAFFHNEFPYNREVQLPMDSWLTFFFLMYLLSDKALDQKLMQADIPCLSIANIPPHHRSAYRRKIYLFMAGFVVIQALLLSLGFVLWLHYVKAVIANVPMSKTHLYYGFALQYVGHVIGALVALYFIAPKFIRCCYFQDEAIPAMEGLKSLSSKEKQFLSWC